MHSFFTLPELLRSNTARCKAIDNTPSFEVVTNLRYLVVFILDPLRKAFGHPIRVTSGYRCPALNAAVGGVHNSQHLSGQAADIVPVSGGTVRDLFKLAQSINLPFDQLILEKGGAWLHISFDINRSRHNVFST